mgnify:CR=1 FL=1
MRTKIIEPEKQIKELFEDFVRDKYGNEEFPAFETAQDFFQDFFNTTFKLNSFKNMSSHPKWSDDYRLTRNDGKVNYYKLVK